MVDDIKASISIPETNLEDTSRRSNNVGVRTRKRRLQTRYYPPRKMARVEVQELQGAPRHGGRDHGGKSNDVVKLSISSNRGAPHDGNHPRSDASTSSVTRSGVNYKGSGHRSENNECKRYHRPMTRLLAGKTSSKNVKLAPGKKSSDASFRELMEQGMVSHILRSINSKATARRQHVNEDDSLYGVGDKALYSPARTFGGSSSLLSKNGRFKNSMKPNLVSKKSLVRNSKIPLRANPGQHGVVMRDTEKEEFSTGKKRRKKSQCKKMRAVKESKEDATTNDVPRVEGNKEDDAIHLPREETNNNGPSPLSLSMEEANPSREDSKAPELPSNEEPNSSLPFEFMPESSDTPSTTRRSKRIAIRSNPERSPSTPRQRMSSLCHRKLLPPPRPSYYLGPRANTSSSSSSSSVYTNNHSPIRPRTSRGPIMASFDTPLSLETEQCVPSSRARTANPDIRGRGTAVSSPSLPFTFMAMDGDSAQKPNFRSISTERSTAGSKRRYRLARIVKSIFRLAAHWLYKLVSAVRPGNVHVNSNQHPSSGIPFSPRDRGSNSQPNSTGNISMSSLPFSFMGRNENMARGSNYLHSSNAERIVISGSKQVYIASIFRYVFHLTINWLLKLVSAARSDNVNVGSNRSSFIPPEPLDISGQFASTLDRPSTARPGRHFLSGARASSTLPLPRPVSNRAFLSTNQRPIYRGDAAQNNLSSPDRSTINGNYVKRRTDTITPRGWEGLFHSKVGEWQCEFCSYMNPEEAMTCDSCTTVMDVNISDANDSSAKYAEEDDAADGSDLDSFVARASIDLDVDAGDNDDGNEESSGYDDGKTSKRIKVDSAGDLKSDGNAAKKAGRTSDATREERLQNPGKGKRIKRASVRGLKRDGGDGISEAMSTDFTDASRSKKRGNSDDGGLEQASKSARAQQMDGSEMFTEDEDEMMDIDSPPR
mmetsp:Transcript_7108/g.15420  ORF Transcript_7108/g.15420 Transcript_7108/m.15420 type:complete len:939 (+) Transcript_7108:65-2881(+)